MILLPWNLLSRFLDVEISAADERRWICIGEVGGPDAVEGRDQNPSSCQQEPSSLPTS
jgi:hypothetical protein